MFDSDVNVGMHRYAAYLGGDAPYRNEVSLNDAGINHWWSTVVYFDQSDESKMFFDIWSHVKDNWEYYSLLYQFPKQLFRTDFCVSIAVHLMNGLNNDDFVHDFLGQPLLNMDQKDVIIESTDPDYFNFLAHDRDENWKNILVHSKNQDVHCMNKRNLKDIIETKIANIILSISESTFITKLEPKPAPTNIPTVSCPNLLRERDPF